MTQPADSPLTQLASPSSTRDTPTADGTKAPAFRIRPVTPDDVKYIMSTWLRSLRSQPDPLPDDLFFGAYRPLLVRLLRTSQTRVMEATDGRRQPILGFSVSWDSEATLHWVYVRDRERGRGLGKALIEHLGACPTHTLRTWSSRNTFKHRLGPHRPSLLHKLQDPAGTPPCK